MEKHREKSTIIVNHFCFSIICNYWREEVRGRSGTQKLSNLTFRPAINLKIANPAREQKELRISDLSMRNLSYTAIPSFGPHLNHKLSNFVIFEEVDGKNVSSMIPSARPTVPPVAIIIFIRSLFCFAIF